MFYNIVFYNARSISILSLYSIVIFFISAAACAPAAGAVPQSSAAASQRQVYTPFLNPAADNAQPKELPKEPQKEQSSKDTQKYPPSKNYLPSSALQKPYSSAGEVFVELEEKPWFYHNDEFSMWNNEFSGYLSLRKPNYNLKTNFKRDANFKRKNSMGFAWFFRSGGRAENYLGFTQLDHSSDLTARGDLNYDVEFDGRKFNIKNGAANVHFSLKINAFDFMVIRRLKNTAWGHINFLYGFRAMQCDLIVKDIHSPVSASYDAILPLPNIGFDARYNISRRLSAYGLLSGFALRRGERGGRFNNLNAAIEYDFKNERKTGVNMSVAAGYKEQYIEADIEENRYVVRHGGPTVKFIAKF
jgi:hypothetical protein